MSRRATAIARLRNISNVSKSRSTPSSPSRRNTTRVGDDATRYSRTSANDAGQTLSASSGRSREGAESGSDAKCSIVIVEGNRMNGRASILHQHTRHAFVQVHREAWWRRASR